MSTFKLPVIKYALLLLSLVSLLCFSCKKSGTDSTVAAIHGTWKMIAVRDNSTGVVITKPPSVPLDVVITFVSTGFGGGVFTGRTTMNEIWESGYFLAQNQTISIPCMSMTKVGETPW